MPPLPPDIIVQLVRDYLPALVVFVFVWFVVPRAVEMVGQYNTHRMEFQSTSFQSKMDFAEKLLDAGEKEQERHLASEEAFRRVIDTLSMELIGLRAAVERLSNRFDEYVQSNKENK